MNVIDVFSGVGGLSLGASKAGFKVLAAIENNQKAISSHKINFPNVVHINQDVRTLNNKLISKRIGGNEKIHGVIGGPPCQAFSSIGKRDLLDERSLLFSEFFRLVDEISPEFFVAENVPGILNSKFDSIRTDAFNIVNKKYNVLEPIVVKSSDYGVPTTRTRVFFIGFKKTSGVDISSFVKNIKRSKKYDKATVKDAFIGLPKKISPNWQLENQSWKKIRISNNKYTTRINARIPRGIGDKKSISAFRNEQKVSGFFGTIHSDKVIKRFKEVQQGSVDKISKMPRLDRKKFAPTLRAGTGPEKGGFQSVRPIHPIEQRVITVREAARIQSFPDWFQFHPTKWHSFRQIGNSVPPLIAEHVLKTIKSTLSY